jgi:ABC-type sugar transport system substrate-binding protein
MGLPKLNIDRPSSIIENYIAGGEVNGILFAANDPVAIAPVLRDALSKGLHVIGFDAEL